MIVSDGFSRDDLLSFNKNVIIFSQLMDHSLLEQRQSQIRNPFGGVRRSQQATLELLPRQLSADTKTRSESITLSTDYT